MALDFGQECLSREGNGGFAMLACAQRFNIPRLLEPIGNIAPAMAGKRHYATSRWCQWHSAQAALFRSRAIDEREKCSNSATSAKAGA